MLEALKKKPHIAKLPKAATLLTVWRQLLKGLNNDGCWVRVPAGVLELSLATTTHAASTSEMVSTLTALLDTLPNIMNKKRRVQAAKDWAEAHKDQCKKVEEKSLLGEDLDARLQALLAGDSFQEGAAADNEGEGAAAVEQEDDEDKQPLKKKARTT